MALLYILCVAIFTNPLNCFAILGDDTFVKSVQYQTQNKHNASLNIRGIKPSYYTVRDTGDTGRTFDGIGAISGGGATSKLLRNYPEKERSEILDFLFKPIFGASLQILKVEIGGDSQSSEGVESSHMHSENDLNYQRGYEWWMMTEAKRRNPSIKFYGLPWTFPGWLGGGQHNPFFNRTKLVTYIVNWVHGAKAVYDLDIHYIGVWNERPYDIQYIKMLKEGLAAAGYGHVKTVAGDAMSWQIVDDYLNSTVLQQALDIVGYHYPGSYSPPRAQGLPIPLWASEEYSATNTLAGGGCWARVLNEGYVNGLFTGYIAWNLIVSYYDDLDFPKMGLMTANQPWSAHYDVNSPIWSSAHHTQFTAPGWHYLARGSGSGNLTGNGTYVSYISPDRRHFTLVIETIDPATSPCFYHMPKYTVSDTQTATFLLPPDLGITALNAWYSHYKFDGSESILFQQVQPPKVVNGSVTVALLKNLVVTLSTVTTAQHGTHPAPPPPANFTVPYSDDFEGYKEHEEAYNLVQQAGAFEIVQTNEPAHGKAIRQMVPEPPVDTCRPEHMPRPVAVIGNFNWSDVTFSVDIYTEAGGAEGVFIAGRVSRGGCWIMYSSGLYLWLYPSNGTLRLTGNFSQSLTYKEISIPLKQETWYTLGLEIQNMTVACSVDGAVVLRVTLAAMPSTNGFLALGTSRFAPALFDNFRVTHAAIARHPSGPFPNYSEAEKNGRLRHGAYR